MTFWDILKIFFVLILLSGLFYFLLMILKKYVYLGNANTSKCTNVKVLANHLLMPKKFVSMVKIFDKIYLLGITDSGITLLDKIDDSSSELENKSLEGIKTKNIWDQLKRNISIR
jgi:flagellar protein FliO/FliZ